MEQLATDLILSGSSDDTPTRPTRQATRKPLLVIEPSRGWVGINWNEVHLYRELLYFLAWRDVKIRYKQTALGTAWAILQPVLTMVVFSLFFGRLAGFGAKTGGIPYPIYVYAGLLPWTFFSNTIANSSNSVVGSSNLITKVYFPRIIIPLASIGAGLVDLALSLGVLLLMMVGYHTAISANLCVLPLCVIGIVAVTAGVGALLAALTVAYRDFRYVVPFLVQIWMFVTPVIYPISIVPAKWRGLLGLNPLAGLVEGCRAALLGSPLNWGQLGLSMIISVALFFAGVAYFRRVERRFADII